MSSASSAWLGNQESELESEFEQEFEGEGEEFLGGLGQMVGGLLGEGESLAESEFEEEGEDEFEGEFEDEDFSLGGFFKKALPIIKKVGAWAAPKVGAAILGPAGAALGGLAAKALDGESEWEGEFEAEDEFEGEFESEGESEAESEIASHPAGEFEALAEMMAEAASQASGEGEAEAMAGAATMTVLSARDRRALAALLPDLLRGTTVLTRILRRSPRTRPLVRAVPGIVRRSVRSLKRRAAKGRPITRRAVARTTAREVRRILGSPRLARATLMRNERASRAMKRHSRSRLRAVRG